MAARPTPELAESVRERGEVSRKAMTSQEASEPQGGRLVRLSTHVLFVEYGEEVEVLHTVRNIQHRVGRRDYEDLLRFRGFRAPAERHTSWIEAGILVPPFHDQPEHHGGFRPGSEAQLARDYQDWYWRHEVEAEREYQWLGYSIVKMPSDLFFYQELLAGHGLDSVLEIGYGGGGGLWFFTSVLALLGEGVVMGVDRDRCNGLPPFERFTSVRIALVHGNAHDEETVEAVRALRPQGFGLVVIDADPRPEGKVALLRRWSTLVAPRGYLVVEDVGSPECRDAAGVIEKGIDKFLLENKQFGVAANAARFPMIKAKGATLQYLPGNAPPLTT